MLSSFTAFLKEYQASPLTLKAYRQSLEAFSQFLAGAEPTEAAVEQFMLGMEKKGLASASVNRHLSAVRAYFLWRKKKAPMSKRGNYDLMVKGPKVHNTLPPLVPAEEIRKLVAATRDDYEKALVMTLYDGALRISELMGLDVSDVYREQHQLRITRKGGDEAVIPVSEPTMRALLVYIGDRQGKVFPQKYWRLAEDLKRIAKRAKVPNIHPHLLRHARAQNLAEKDVPVAVAQELLGHKNIQTTMRYYRLNPRKLQKDLPNAF